VSGCRNRIDEVRANAEEMLGNTSGHHPEPTTDGKQVHRLCQPTASISRRNSTSRLLVGPASGRRRDWSCHRRPGWISRMLRTTHGKDQDGSRLIRPRAHLAASWPTIAFASVLGRRPQNKQAQKLARRKTSRTPSCEWMRDGRDQPARGDRDQQLIVARLPR